MCTRGLIFAAVIGAVACGGADAVEGEVTVPADFVVNPGVELATVVGAEPRARLTLYDPTGKARVTIIADDLGQAHFAYLPIEHLTLESGEGTKIPIADGSTIKRGDGYVIRDDSLIPPAASPPFTVLGVHDVPPVSAYDDQPLDGIITGPITVPPEGQTNDDGFQYITVRDGVRLSVMVRFPDPALYGDGPWPTVIEYSGYSTSRPSRPEPGSEVASLLGFATVGVNMRGSGCSGGVFDVFNPAQHADGYDVVEVVARQPWVLNNRVGMVGLSYSGIAQLFVARTNPPSLAAVTPLSVIADPWEELWPGGIYNSGFTRQWLAERDRQASSGGQSWTQNRIDGGDTICEAHQALRNQNIDFASFFRLLEFFPNDAQDRSLPRLVGEIELPVFVAGAFHDEQTGPQFANMIDAFTAAPAKKFTLYNGRHPDGYSPLMLGRWFEFLELYVAGRVPRLNPLVRIFASEEFSNEFGIPDLEFEADRFADYGDDEYDAVLAAFEAEPTVRVLFESGGSEDYAPGAPVARFETSYDTFPPPDAKHRSFYLGPGGTLNVVPPPSVGSDSFRHDPEAGAVTFFGPRGYELMVPLWDIEWTEFAEGDLLSYLTAPLSEEMVVLGPGWVELWLESEADDAALQATLTEVRPDGNEVLVTSGWLRAGHRKIDRSRSDILRIERTFSKQDYAPLPTWPVSMKIPIPAVGHVFRVGSRLRLMISAPGRNHGTWEFDNLDESGATPVHSILRGGWAASRLYLPIVEGLPVPDSIPACPSLRGQPCRPYRPKQNTIP